LSRSPGRYTRQVLRPGEEVIAVGRFHWLYTVIAILCLLLLGRFLIGVLIFVRMMVDKWTTEIVITSDRLIYKRGWIFRHVEEIALNQIEEVVLDQTAIGRMLGYGRIVVAGTGRGVIRLPGWLANPVRIRRGLRT
jgi:Predicted membrane protein